MTHAPHLKPTRIALAIASCAVLISAHSAHAASLAIAQVPLYLGGTVEPNILFVLDDSGSMYWSFMPDSIYGNRTTNRAKSSTYNKIYYNPALTYSAPLDKDGNKLADASFTAAWFDGYDLSNRSSNTTNLSTSFRPTWYYAGTSTEWSGNAEPAYYYEYSAACGNVNSDGCYTKKLIAGSGQEQNFANWYSYYRNRMYAAKAGVSRAFGTQGTGMRVAYGRINKSSGTIDGVSTSTLDRGVRDFGDVDIYGNTTNYRKDYFDWLFTQQPTGSTPLRRALDAAGQYFERTDSQGPASTTPGVSGGKDLSCRQNFTILTTDGYWSAGSSYDANTANARLNQDGSNGAVITGPNNTTGQYLGVAPFADSFSDTLADVAAYYYKRDLRTDLTNNVPVNSDDPAFWQHMVTFGVGLGVNGTINPTTAFNAIATGTDPGWPDPTSSDPAKIDDLLHAALNSRGQFFSAGDPDTFATALSDTLAAINARTSSAATIASNSARLSTTTLLYQASFDSDGWTGDMLAYKIEQDTTKSTYGQPIVPPAWQASKKIPAVASRNLITYDPTTQNGITFTWGALTTSQKTALSNDSTLLDWVRGDQSKEQSKGGTFRNRNSILGDVVNSDPAFVGTEDYNYALAASLSASERSAYATRRLSTTFQNRKHMLYFGANDGMLHGIDAALGNERLGYIPNAVIAGLPDLAAINYTHKYYVDGAPRVADAKVGSSWKTVLVGSTGAGGKSYFALDVEDGYNFTTSNVLWEVSNTTSGFSELGYSIGQASIVRTESGHWVAIFGNGYNSTSQTARLFVVDLATGAKLAEIDTHVGNTTTPNGLATPIAVDANRNGSIDLVYAGDLYGNLWKFDFTGNSISSWKVAFGSSTTPKPLFIAKDSNGNRQPITAKPQVGSHPDGGTMIYFGTGKYFETGDNTDLAVQSLYGVRDECGLATASCTTTNASKVARSDLLQQTITYEGTQTFNGNQWEIRQFSQNTPTTSHRGFYVDLIYGTNALGERILATPLLWSDRVIFVSAIPDNDACAGGGSSWIIELAPQSGARTDFSVFDLAKDGSYGATSEYNNKAVNARKVVGGMIKNLGQLRGVDGKTHKYGSTSTRTIDTSTQQNSGSRRISWRQIQ
ncbi:MAG: hypothetical protein KDE68_12700 [Rhodocyclaceae bacterium]|nr:hypothetical protein [Rhodocyclaceae bacterium]